MVSVLNESPDVALGKPPLRVLVSDVVKPLDRIGIHILGPLSITQNGNEYILVHM